jgi:hypothetical protein
MITSSDDLIIVQVGYQFENTKHFYDRKDFEKRVN